MPCWSVCGCARVTLWCPVFALQLDAITAERRAQSFTLSHGFTKAGWLPQFEALMIDWRGDRLLTVLLDVQGTCPFPTNATITGWNLTGPELLQLKPAQCIVVCDTDCLRVRGTPLWLHNIYLRFKRTQRSDKPTAVLEDTSNEVCLPIPLSSTDAHISNTLLIYSRLTACESHDSSKPAMFVCGSRGFRLTSGHIVCVAVAMASRVPLAACLHELDGRIDRLDPERTLDVYYGNADAF